MAVHMLVPHDVEGMVELMGGREAVLRDLTEFFDKTPSDMLWNDYYNHANEPVQHIPSYSTCWASLGLRRSGRATSAATPTTTALPASWATRTLGRCRPGTCCRLGHTPRVPGNGRYEITSPRVQPHSFQPRPVIRRGQDVHHRAVATRRRTSTYSRPS